MKIITCDKCFSIPKITIVNPNKIEVECSICKTVLPLEINYFKRFTNNEKDNLFTLPNCNYNRNHISTAIEFCFKCNKYLCQECLNNHNETFEGQRHTTIKQRINHQFYCNKQGHEDNILNRFCTKCNNYLCSDCKCEHSDEYKDNFSIDENKINEIKSNLKKSKSIIEEEERKFRNFIKKFENKINILTNMFNDYKKRNLELISFYNILIDNYEQMKTIKNYNLRNNIFSNNNFNLNNSITYSDDCLSSNYNRLCEFYRQTNHVKPKKMPIFF